MYSIKETYYTIQGEGFHTGRPAVFLRFAGCNLWTGREADREQAICRFCDTDFFGVDGPGGGRFKTAEELAKHVAGMWPSSGRDRFVVCTGGEPALQIDSRLVDAFHGWGFEVAIETNGTLVLPDSIDWVCVSPKAGADVVVRTGNELKVVLPQSGISLAKMSEWKFDHYYVQPMDSSTREENTQAAIELCLDNPQWKLSVQMHKYLNVP